MKEKTPEWVSIAEAAERLGVHRNTMSKRVTQWQLTTRRNPRNLREVLVNWTEVDTYLEGFEPGKMAA